MSGSATAEQVLALLSSHAAGDESRFALVALQIAAGEAQKGRRDLADEIKRLLDESRRPKVDFSAASAVHVATPQGELENLLAISQPDIRLKQMTLSQETRERFERVLREQRGFEALQQHGLSPRRKLLFVGPPGCGKTMAASALATELGLPLCVVRLENLVTKYLGETSVKLRMVFDAIERTRAVYLFDEFDSLGVRRGASHDVGEMRRILNSFLVFLEASKGHSLVIAASNHGRSLDEALFRRFDDVIEFELPDKQRRRAAFSDALAALSPSLETLNTIARESNGLSYGEIVRVSEDSLKEAVLKRLDGLPLSILRDSLKSRYYRPHSTRKVQGR